MRKYLLSNLLFLVCVVAFGQIGNDTIDNKYFEDQFYFSANYNILVNRPKPNENNLFSGGFNIGYIRDIPFNKRRNFGLGIGLGYDYNAYSKHITIFNDPDDQEGINEEYHLYKFRTSLVEVPIEIRWRTSTATTYKFWRIYAGMTFGYVFYSKFKTKEESGKDVRKNLDVFERFQYGVSFSAGYSTWNVYAYYGISPIFKNLYTSQDQRSLKDFKIGLKFYIL